MFHFYAPWKRQKTFDFLTFSGGIGMEHQAKMGQDAHKHRIDRCLMNFSFDCSFTGNLIFLQVCTKARTEYGGFSIETTPLGKEGCKISDTSPLCSPIPEVNFVRCHTISSSPDAVKVLKKQVPRKETEQNENLEETVKLRKSKSKSTLADIINKPKSKVIKKKNSKIKLLSGQKKLTQFFTTL